MIEPPLIVQTDRTVLLETQHPQYEPARDRLARFAELEKSPEYVHFYRITPVSIWNAAALGESVDDLVSWLEANARFPIAPAVLSQALSPAMEARAARYWSGRQELRQVLQDVIGAAHSLLGENLFGKLRALLARRGIVMAAPREPASDADLAG